MFQVLATAVAMATVLVLSRFWKPTRGKGLYQGFQGAALGCMLACGLAALLTLAFPGPFRLAIYTLSLNLLLTPSLATAGTIRGIGMKPRKEPPPKKGKAKKTPPPKAAEPQHFSEVMAQVAGSHEPPCEEVVPTSIEE